ncbi:hypothetical protein CNMCM8980_002985 [Aspergillus fumigatiaffinis]|uniref:Uncharacterized protein n=1 Tax=Aspergillus fumigatiaffinis TaxID=340414 RepID=A0A8H4GVZ1_9EURO|nr:hypothetical protein CNMCM5878_001239 [Aspergillus fumigatiaffinis]KAF4222802.1 hypothetical protein CNMCM6457_001118 [Aspergillus fumigatiaffinis]KAF4229760.1 hypothetical protein CNMCM6805_001152 [Aspergillus fumigatiaffinis]KAF4236213.1 hypothetical protein CNMCM8980_002985 [Aspergillus fumigatiaffinis]
MTTILDIPGTNPPNPFTTPIQTLLLSINPSSTPNETATHLITAITTSTDPAHSLWQLWDAFFTAVATSTTHAPHLALLDAIRTQPPTQPTNIRAGSDAHNLRSYSESDGKLNWAALPRFSAQWRDVHDILEAWRDWDGVRESISTTTATTTTVSPSSGAEYFLRFCAFSAALLKATNGKGGVHPIWVFYACCDVLEREQPRLQAQQPKTHRISQEKVWALDVRVAVTWVRDGAVALWEADGEELRRHWGAALDEKTELWPRKDGLTRERWELWGRRLRELSTEGVILDGEMMAVVEEAAKLVSRLLKRTD